MGRGASKEEVQEVVEGELNVVTAKIQKLKELMEKLTRAGGDPAELAAVNRQLTAMMADLDGKTRILSESDLHERLVTETVAEIGKLKLEMSTMKKDSDDNLLKLKLKEEDTKIQLKAEENKLIIEKEKLRLKQTEQNNNLKLQGLESDLKKFVQVNTFKVKEEENNIRKLEVDNNMKTKAEEFELKRTEVANRLTVQQDEIKLKQTQQAEEHKHLLQVKQEDCNLERERLKHEMQVKEKENLFKEKTFTHERDILKLQAQKEIQLEGMKFLQGAGSEVQMRYIELMLKKETTAQLQLQQDATNSTLAAIADIDDSTELPTVDLKLDT